MNKISTKTIARIAAVQALYQYQINDKKQIANELIQDLVAYYADTDREMYNDLALSLATSPKIKLNINYFTTLVQYTIDHLDIIDDLIMRNLSGGWTIDNLHITLMALLRSAICELKCFPETPYKVIINEFTDIASDLLKDNEVDFVNSILDKINTVLRSESVERY